MVKFLKPLLYSMVAMSGVQSASFANVNCAPVSNPADVKYPGLFSGSEHVTILNLDNESDFFDGFSAKNGETWVVMMYDSDCGYSQSFAKEFESLAANPEHCNKVNFGAYEIANKDVWPAQVAMPKKNVAKGIGYAYPVLAVVTGDASEARYIPHQEIPDYLAAAMMGSNVNEKFTNWVTNSEFGVAVADVEKVPVYRGPAAAPTVTEMKLTAENVDFFLAQMGPGGPTREQLLATLKRQEEREKAAAQPKPAPVKTIAQPVEQPAKKTETKSTKTYTVNGKQVTEAEFIAMQQQFSAPATEKEPESEITDYSEWEDDSYSEEGGPKLSTEFKGKCKAGNPKHEKRCQQICGGFGACMDEWGMKKGCYCFDPAMYS